MSNNRDIYQEVTDQIIEALETADPNGVEMPWQSLGTGHPHNYSSGHQYRGVNVLLLWCAAMKKGYSHNGWMTFKQIKEMGGHVRKGEKGQLVTFWKMLDKKGTDDAGEATVDKVPLLRHYVVFNVEQCDGLDIPEPEALPEWERIEKAEALIKATRANITEAGDMACFAPELDQIRIPQLGQFKSPEHYYATLLHELTHWTGHKSRLDRDMRGRFGSQSYAAEELVAEMGAAFLCASLDITGNLQHPEYIKNWLQVLKDDKKAIFTASSKAQKAADFIHSFSNTGEQELAA